MTPEQVLGESEDRVVRPVYVERRPEEGGGEYHYFEPVNFKKTCLHCHTNAWTAGPISAAEIGESYAAEEPPMMAVKVILPYEGNGRRHQQLARDPDCRGDSDRLPGHDHALPDRALRDRQTTAASARCE